MLAIGSALVVGIIADAAHAAIITCNDTGLTYATSCPSTEAGRCINPLGPQNGCCNKGTCNGSVCVTGPDQDAQCINDGNDCVNQACAANAQTYQATCTPSNAPNGSCAATGNVNTCAAEQAQNPSDQPVCKPWTCVPATGCDRVNVLNDPVVACDDGKDCTTGDHCINGTCGKGSSGTVLQNEEPCRNDDTTLGNGDNRTWCNAGACLDDDEACDETDAIAAGQPCDPNNCTNATCQTRGGVCLINSCNTGQTVDCEPCGQTLECVNYGAGQNANFTNACGCLSLF
jgi:hypothetical protein